MCWTREGREEGRRKDSAKIIVSEGCVNSSKDSGVFQVILILFKPNKVTKSQGTITYTKIKTNPMVVAAKE